MKNFIVNNTQAEPILWTRLIDYSGESLWAGTVFRFPAQYPFETVVDFMLYFDSASQSGLSMLCTTGREAGNKECALPERARVSHNAIAISKKWLLKNWTEWVYAKTALSEIQIIPHYPEGRQ